MRGDGSPAVYDARAETRAYFETHNRPHWFANNARKFAQRRADELRLIDPRPTDVVLEIGTARGDATRVIAPLVRRVISVDIAPAALEVAREALDREGIGNVELVLDDAATLARVASASVDKAFAYDLIEHIPDAVLVAMLQQAARVVRPGGTLSIYTPCGSHYVERLRGLKLLPAFPEHIAVRTTAATLALVAAVPAWRVDMLWHSPSCYPVFGLFDRVFHRLPGIGPLFRHKTCLRLRRLEMADKAEKTPATSSSASASWTPDTPTVPPLLVRLRRNPHLLRRGVYGLVNCWLHRLKFLVTGKRVSIGPMSRVYGTFRVIGSGRVKIGRNALIIGDYVRSVTFVVEPPEAMIEAADDVGFNGTVIHCVKSVRIGSLCNFAAAYITDSQSHALTSDRRTNLDASVDQGDVVFEDNVWLAMNTVVSYGVTIGRNSVVGALSMVTHSVPPDSVVFGIPARVVKEIPPATEPSCARGE